ncbi:hypothetical protein [Acidithiobacillus ferridurans]|uniref:Uncharacterized protein n=1 Tax=Acidithiobacillus ferridurans TaxID=1232575 RepID=A0A8X8GD88_ACIFI|nr:hypothetical protein [Acidithiobacillus ferridurans]MBU2715863.1 hypothetical protein [Acidithiobacillus ferridurans]MBU2723415.1 hypothetical protein [Acidithiobacillus ferridurans]MBU2728052.1 hypothetical protein [Acidithiobacillus ferridurans]MDA8376488.1 hypothetical protein [Planctomycetia bacterium]
MSRTIRRKNAKHEYYWVLREWVRLCGWHYVPIRVDPYSNDGRKRIAEFHSDHANIMDHMGPRWFRVTQTHRPDRRAANADIQRWVANGMDTEGDWNMHMSRTYRHSVFFDYWD